MKISVIQQKLGFGYDSFGDLPSLSSLKIKAAERIDECLRLIDKAAEEGTDLAVTTETVNAITVLGDERYDYTELFGGIDSETVRRFSEAAERNRIYIVAGLILTIDGSAYNCAVLFNRAGEIVGIHKKVHLPAGEERHVKAGDRYDVYETELGNIGMLVCWDMQYPEAARELALGGADLICCPTLGWENIYGLCRAYENGVTIAAAMCVFDPSAAPMCGPSCIVDNMGRVIVKADPRQTCVVSAEVDVLSEPRPQYHSDRFYPSDSMRRTRFVQRRPETYRLASRSLEDTPLYNRYFDEKTDIG